MSWKPCRGGRVILDKSIKNSHDCYFAFNEATTIKEKSKIALKWLRADQYLGNERHLLIFWGNEFIQQCKSSPDTYKPFLKALTQLTIN